MRLEGPLQFPVVDILLASVLSIGGVAMTSLPFPLLAGIFGAAIAFAFLLDLVKLPVFKRLGLT